MEKRKIHVELHGPNPHGSKVSIVQPDGSLVDIPGVASLKIGAEVHNRNTLTIELSGPFSLSYVQK